MISDPCVSHAPQIVVALYEAPISSKTLSQVHKVKMKFLLIPFALHATKTNGLQAGHGLVEIADRWVFEEFYGLPFILPPTAVMDWDSQAGLIQTKPMPIW